KSRWRESNMSSASDTVSAYAETKPAKGGMTKATLRKILMYGGVGAFLVIAGGFYLAGGRYIGADDSYVHANKLMVSTDVSGLVKTVNVHEGQQVKAGDILFTLDPLPFQIALANARAALASTAQDVESTRAMYRAALGQIAAEQAHLTVNQQPYN